MTGAKIARIPYTMARAYFMHCAPLIALLHNSCIREPTRSRAHPQVRRRKGEAKEAGACQHACGIKAATCQELPLTSGQNNTNKIDSVILLCQCVPERANACWNTHIRSNDVINIQHFMDGSLACCVFDLPARGPAREAISRTGFRRCRFWS